MGKWIHRLSEIDEDARKALCLECGITDIVSTGHRLKNGNIRWQCVVPKRHGNRFNRGGGRKGGPIPDITDFCSICGDYMLLPNLDHDHDTGLNRNWLCRSCNIGLGYFKDSPETLTAAANYLIKYGK